MNHQAGAQDVFVIEDGLVIGWITNIICSSRAESLESAGGYDEDQPCQSRVARGRAFARPMPPDTRPRSMSLPPARRGKCARLT